MKDLYQAAIPQNDDDWGSDRQIEAECAFFIALAEAGLDLDEDEEFQTYATGATTAEFLAEAWSRWGKHEEETK